MQQLAKITLLFFGLVSQAFHAVQAQEGTSVELIFAPSHGFYDQQIEVSITAQTVYFAIHYTLDGSAPAITVGQSTRLYQNPIVVNKTSVIRAMAILADGSKSDIMTQTYLFIDDIIQQDYQATLNAGFPIRWGATTPDYGMDPYIVNNSTYGAHLDEALLSIPSLSIVMKIDDLFGPNGIYTHSVESGEDWERPCSAELIFPDQREGFQINCGVRIQGGWFRQHEGTKKHSFRLLFKTDYGSTKLRYPLFGDEAADRFDTIVLRGGANDGYSWSDARYTEQYTRDEFGRRLHEWSEDASPHGMFLHLYLNGTYWGLYNPVERPDDSFSAIYHGGDKSNWDAINSGELDEGSMDAWNLLLAKCRSGVSSQQRYMEIQGKNPDGTRNPEFPLLLDVQNYIDYMIVNMWGGNWDWPWKNYRIARDRTQASTGFQFYIWDYENVMGNNRDRSPLDMDRVNGLTSMGAGVGELHVHLLKNDNYRLLFADRIQKLFFNDGPFTPAFLLEKYKELAGEIELAIIAESARWGDQHYDTDPLTLDDWFAERDWILNTYLPQRSDIVMSQFRRANLYPVIAAPIFSVNDRLQHGGAVTSADKISIKAAEGTIYYTLDGSDPRSVSSSGSNDVILVPEDMPKHALVPAEAISQIWTSAPGFDVTNWLLCQGLPGGVGYERESGYDGYITLDVEDEMYAKNSSCYIRIPFTLSANLMDNLVTCTLRVRYDDGFIAYLNGTEVARRNFTGTPRWNSGATSQNADQAAILFEDIDIKQYISKFREGTNILAIHGLNERTTSSDFLMSVELTGGGNSHSIPSFVSPSAIEYSTPFTLSQTAQIKSRVYANGGWSALNEAVFTLPLSQNNTIVSELHYHPLPQDAFDESEFEFIELFNAGSETQNLSLARFVKGVNYHFPANTILRPNDYLVLASDEHYFTLRYGFSPFGVYSGQLDNGGEQIVLLDASGDTLISCRYDDKSPWPESADGDGYSLVLDKIELFPDYDNAASWHASKKIHGEPGRLNVLVSPEKDGALPGTLLRQNYPNPFNSLTKIIYFVPKKSHITLKVYNLLGQEVTSLFEGVQQAGNYTATFDGSGLSSGVYLCRMTARLTDGGQAENCMDAKKIMLLK